MAFLIPTFTSSTHLHVRTAARTAAFLAALLVAGSLAAFPSSPPPGRAGDPPGTPPDNTCAARFCHDSFELNAGDVTLSLVETATGSPFTGYEPGIAYDLQLSVTSGEAGREAWGFELIPLAGLDPAGELSAGPSSSLISSGDRTYLGHSPAIETTTGGTWDFAWTAPATDVGDVVFYACGNAANDADGNRGDYIECATFTVSPGGGGSTAVLRIARWQVAPIPSPDAILGVDPCTTSSPDFRTCDETSGSVAEIDGPLPLTVDGAGLLVFLEYDSDTSTAGTADSLRVQKADGGQLLVSAP